MRFVYLFVPTLQSFCRTTYAHSAPDLFLPFNPFRRDPSWINRTPELRSFLNQRYVTRSFLSRGPSPLSFTVLTRSLPSVEWCKLRSQPHLTPTSPSYPLRSNTCRTSTHVFLQSPYTPPSIPSSRDRSPPSYVSFFVTNNSLFFVNDTHPRPYSLLVTYCFNLSTQPRSETLWLFFDYFPKVEIGRLVVFGNFQKLISSLE